MKRMSLVLLMAALCVAAQGASVIPFQGQLTDQTGAPLNPSAAVNLVFRIYQAPTGGTASWEETQPSVVVIGGRFNVLLGSRTPFDTATLAAFNNTVYLGITVDDGNAATTDVELRPRQAIVPVIFAENARNADKLDGFDWSSLLINKNTLAPSGDVASPDVIVPGNKVGKVAEAENATHFSGIAQSYLFEQPLDIESPVVRMEALPPAIDTELSNMDDSALDDTENIGSVVEVEAGSSKLRLAVDLVSTQTLLRGVYRGNGTIQVEGLASVQSSSLLTGSKPVFLSDTEPGQIVNATEVMNRLFATRVGFASADGSRVRLQFGYTQTREAIVLEDDVEPLVDPGFEQDSTVWFRENNSNEGFSFASHCAGDAASFANNPTVFVYQSVDVPEYLYPVVNSNGIRVEYGASVEGGTCLMRVDFYDESNEPIDGVNGATPSPKFDSFLILGESGACVEKTKFACVPANTRFIRVALGSLNSTRSNIDNVVMKIQSITAGGQCP